MLIKEVIAMEGLFDVPAASFASNKPAPLLTANQQQQAVANSHKRKLIRLVAAKQQKDRLNALQKVTAHDKLMAFIAAQQVR